LIQAMITSCRPFNW